MKRGPKIVLGILVAGMVVLTLAAAFVCWAVRRTLAPTPPVLVTVVVSSPGRSASDLEHLVAIPLEDRLAGIPSLRSLKTRNTEGAVRITCEFDGASAPIEAMNLVRDHVRVDQLPEDLEAPAVGLASRRFAIARYDLTHDTLPLAELVKVHDEQLRDELLSMPSVERLEMCGAGEPEVLVELNPRQLETFGVRAEQVRGEVGRWSSILGGGGKLEELGELIIGQAQSGPIRLNDVASLRTSQSPHGCACVVDGEPALCVSVFGWQEAGARSVVDRVRQWAESAPPGLRVRTEESGEKASCVRFGLWVSGDARSEKAQETAQLVSSVAQPLSDVAYRVTVGSGSVLAGSDGPSGELSLAFKDVPAADFEVRVRQAVEASLPGIGVAPLQRGAWEFVVRGPDRSELVRIAQELRKLADAREGVVQALVVGAGQRSSFEFQMKRERAGLLGILPRDVIFAARLAVEGELVGAAEPGRPGIRLVWAGGEQQQLDQLRSLRLPSASGGNVPLGEVVDVRAQTLDDPIVREDRQRVVYVRVWGEPGASDSWAEGVGGAATAIPLPKGITVRWRTLPDG